MPLGFIPVPSPQDKKPKHVEVEIASVPAGRSVYANTYSIERDEHYLILHFSYQSDQTGVFTKAVAIGVSINDILNQVSNWERYMEQTAPLVEPLGPFKRPVRSPFAPDIVEAANVVQMSRMGWTAEIAFSLFGVHELILWKEGQPNIIASRFLTVRCSLHMQTDILFRILELVGPDKEIDQP